VSISAPECQFCASAPGYYAAAAYGSAAMCAITAASGCNGACRLFRSAGDLIAEYLLVPPRARARVPTHRTASYGHQVTTAA
jgi:hypothetical protein